MTRAATWFLRLNALILVACALAFTVDPLLLGRIMGFTANSPNTAVEITAFYGGLEFGLAIYLLWGSLHPARLYTTLVAFFVTFLCVGLFRFMGMLRFGFEGLGQPVFVSMEILFSLVGGVLAKSLKPRHADP